MTTLIIIIVSIILSGFFSGSETAFFSLGKPRVDALINKGNNGMRLVKKLKSDPGKLIITILIGNNIVNVGSSAIITYLITEQFGSEGVGIATGIMTFLILTFGEIIPKSIAAKFSVQVTLVTAPIIYALEIILYPFNFFFGKFSDFVNKLLSKFSDEKSTHFPVDEIKALAHISYEEGSLTDYELKVIKRVFNLNRKTAKSKMTHIDKVFFANGDKSILDLKKNKDLQRYSRIPVFTDRKNNIIGFLLVKDLVQISPDQLKSTLVKDIMREPIFINQNDQLYKIFSKLRRSKVQIAIVQDDNKENIGILTLEDIIEEMTGIIKDETDPRN